MPLRIYGATSGYVDLEVPDVADNGTVTLSPSLMSPGLVLIRKESFSGVASKSVDGVFTSTYKNYRIIARFTGTVAGQTNIRFRTAGADYTGANYKWRAAEGVFTSTTNSGAAGSDLTTGRFGYWAALESSTEMDVMSPALTEKTHMHSQHQYGDGYGTQGSLVNVTNSFDGFTVYPTSGTLSGEIYVYGYAEVVGDYPQLNQVPGLSLVTTQTFSAASAVSVDNCFTSQYDNYRIAWRINKSAGAETRLRWRVAGADATGADHLRSQGSVTTTGTAGAYVATTETFHYLNAYSTASHDAGFLDAFSPAVATPTFGFYQSISDTAQYGFAAFKHNVSAAYDGFTLYPGSGTIAGSIYVYGYRKA